MNDDLVNQSARIRFADISLDKGPSAPIQLTILAKPPLHLMRRAKPTANLPIVREAPVYEGWSHRGKARIGNRMHSVWQRMEDWTFTLGAKLPEGPVPLYSSLDVLIESTQATQYKGIAKKVSKGEHA